MRPHTAAEARAVVELVTRWQRIFRSALGHRMVFAADEYYLMAGVGFPEADEYEDFSMHEDGIGMARTFELEFTGRVDAPTGPQSGFFAWVDGAPAAGYRAPRNPAGDTGLRGGQSEPVAVGLSPRANAPVGVLTGEYGARVIQPLIASLDRDDVRVIPVVNRYFGGNTAVTGLMVGEDIARTLESEPSGHRYLIPDVCLSEGRFLDGLTVGDLPRPVEVVATDGIALRRALASTSPRTTSTTPV
jgi:NifB/MoaA-like Fe-S oxidoreductase